MDGKADLSVRSFAVYADMRLMIYLLVLVRDREGSDTPRCVETFLETSQPRRKLSAD